MLKDERELVKNLKTLFKGSGSSILKNVYFVEGLQQTLSFGLFGFDSLVLWHVFPKEMENKSIEERVRHTNEIIEGFSLPIVYFATKFADDGFEFFAPLELYSSAIVDANYLLKNLRDFCDKKRNPLLNSEDVQNRKKTLKVLLKIPV